jgi:small-conductance mechanosensitive channel
MAGRLIVPVSVAYDSDPREVERILQEIAEEHPMVLDDPPPAVIFASMGDSAINFELRCRLRDVNFSLTVRSDMNFAVFERFRAAGIVFPFPQRVVQIIGGDDGEAAAAAGGDAARGDKPA